MNFLAVIPARGGSKGIPGKNIKLLAGKPLITYSIEAAFNTKLINKIVVSTDDDGIAKISKNYNSEVVMRPDELANDDSPTIDAVIHVINSLEKDGYFPDIVVLLQPTSPLRNTEDIDNCIDLFIKNKDKYDSLVSVCEFEHSPYLSLKIEEGYLKPYFGEEYLNKRRQELSKLYMPNGSIFISKKKNILKSKSFYNGNIIPYFMNTEESIDIDSFIDFKLAEIILDDKFAEIEIENTIVEKDQPSFIIAEAGVNHNGSLNIAKKLIDAAKESGADAVKFQTFKTEDLVTKNAEKAEYQKESITENSQYEMIKKLELSADDFRELAKYADRKDIIFLSSPFDFESVDLLEEIGVPAFKLGSGEITNFPLLEHVARKGMPVILSTGMATMDEIEEAVNLFQDKTNDLILMHCVTSYPAKIDDVNLKVIETLRSTFKLPVGFSDHTLGIEMPIAAVARGSCVIEKHFTLDKNLEGPDHKASLEPADFKKMVLAIRNVEKGMGNGIKEVTNEEKEMKKVARKSIIAKVRIPKETVITGEMLVIKRPGTGIEPKYLKSLIGKTTTSEIKKDDILRWNLLK